MYLDNKYFHTNCADAQNTENIQELSRRWDSERELLHDDNIGLHDTCRR